MSRDILDQAYHHFQEEGRRYEYGRGDKQFHNKSPNGHTDPSRNEKDLDGDGLYGVDCSALVWRGLKNAGYDVGNTPFDTSALFTGHQVTNYARSHFDVISAQDAARTNGHLQPGDVLMFNGEHGRHVGIFKGYDAQGHIEFYGSQVTTGPAVVASYTAPGQYWNGRDFQIVGALRAKPEFRIAEPHQVGSSIDAVALPAAPATHPGRHESTTTTQPHQPTRLEQGAHGDDVQRLQNELIARGYTDSAGHALKPDSHFGYRTREALESFQHDHGLKPDGIAGPATLRAMQASQLAQHGGSPSLDQPAHPGHAMFRQGLDGIQQVNHEHGIAPSARDSRIAGALAVEATTQGLERIDHVLLNDDASRVFAVQGKLQGGIEGLDQKRASVDTMTAIATPLEQSSQQWTQAAQHAGEQRQAAQEQAQTATQAQPQSPQGTGLSL